MLPLITSTENPITVITGLETDCKVVQEQHPRTRVANPCLTRKKLLILVSIAATGIISSVIGMIVVSFFSISPYFLIIPLAVFTVVLLGLMVTFCKKFKPSSHRPLSTPIEKAPPELELNLSRRSSPTPPLPQASPLVPEPYQIPEPRITPTDFSTLVDVLVQDPLTHEVWFHDQDLGPIFIPDDTEEETPQASPLVPGPSQIPEPRITPTPPPQASPLVPGPSQIPEPRITPTDFSTLVDVLVPDPLTRGSWFHDQDLGPIFIPDDTEEETPQASPLVPGPSQIPEPRITPTPPPQASPLVPRLQQQPGPPAIPITIPGNRPQNAVELAAHIEHILGPNCWRKTLSDYRKGIRGQRKHPRLGLVNIYAVGCNYSSVPPSERDVNCSFIGAILLSSDPTTDIRRRNRKELDTAHAVTAVILLRDDLIITQNSIADPYIKNPKKSSIMDPLIKNEIFKPFNINPQLQPGEVWSRRLFLKDIRCPSARYPNPGCAQIVDLMLSHKPTLTQSYDKLRDMYGEAIKKIQPSMQRLIIVTPPFHFTHEEREVCANNGLDTLIQEKISEHMTRAAFLEAFADVLGELENPSQRFPQGVFLLLNTYYTYEI